MKHGIHFFDYQPNNKVLQYSHHVISTSISLYPIKHKGGCLKWRLDIEDQERILNDLHECVEPLDIYFIFVELAKDISYFKYLLHLILHTSTITCLDISYFIFNLIHFTHTCVCSLYGSRVCGTIWNHLTHFIFVELA